MGVNDHLEEENKKSYQKGNLEATALGQLSFHKSSLFGVLQATSNPLFK